MPHSDHIDRWQREREGTPDPATPEEYIARMRDLLDQAAMRDKLQARPDLLERLRTGDTTALAEIVEHGTGATVDRTQAESRATYRDVTKTIRNAEGEVVLTIPRDVVVRSSTAWKHLQDAASWTTKAVGYGPGYTVTFEVIP